MLLTMMVFLPSLHRQGARVQQVSNSRPLAILLGPLAENDDSLLTQRLASVTSRCGIEIGLRASNSPAQVSTWWLTGAGRRQSASRQCLGLLRVRKARWRSLIPAFWPQQGLMIEVGRDGLFQLILLHQGKARTTGRLVISSILAGRGPFLTNVVWATRSSGWALSRIFYLLLA